MNLADLQNMHRICSNDYGGKLRLLLDYTDHPDDGSDPDSGDFYHNGAAEMLVQTGDRPLK